MSRSLTVQDVAVKTKYVQKLKTIYKTCFDLNLLPVRGTELIEIVGVRKRGE